MITATPRPPLLPLARTTLLRKIFRLILITPRSLATTTLIKFLVETVITPKVLDYLIVATAIQAWEAPVAIVTRAIIATVTAWTAVATWVLIVTVAVITAACYKIYETQLLSNSKTLVLAHNQNHFTSTTLNLTVETHLPYNNSSVEQPRIRTNNRKEVALNHIEGKMVNYYN